MSQEAFVPRVAPGPFSMASHLFCSSGPVDPGVIWFDAWHPGEPRLEPMERYVRAVQAKLPLGSDEIGRACESLFGPPTDPEARGYPYGADWVLTTPMDGVYVIVRLPGHKLDRLGFGIELGLLEEITGPRNRRGRPGARQDAETRVEEAVLATLKAIRTEMEAAPAPMP